MSDLAGGEGSGNSANLTEVLYLQVSQFLFREAEVLDTRAFDRWIDLWQADDITYWVPCNSDDGDVRNSLSIILDDREHLEERVSRLLDKKAHTFQPQPRTQRLVGNICIEEICGNEIVATSIFSLAQTHRERHSFWFGRSRHELLVQADKILIRKKKVCLLNNDDAMPNLLFLP